MSSNLSFFTNENGESLQDRFRELIQDSKYFDCLVGYFYISGFHLIRESLEVAEKIRILIGISTNEETYSYIKHGIFDENNLYSHRIVKEKSTASIINEVNSSDDSYESEIGIEKFIEWVRTKKLEIRAYPSKNIHAKLYIVTFKEGDRDKGRIITGSSNFTKGGLRDNLELNVELREPGDYQFAKEKFNSLWEDAVAVSEEFVQAINEKTWLKPDITPYDLYLKALYEYFREDLNPILLRSNFVLPEKYMDLKFQNDAVGEAKKKLEKFGGVFISDVVGLGKTILTARLVKELNDGVLVIAPPALISRSNPSSWRNVFSEFGIPAEYESIGKLDDVVNSPSFDLYKTIVIDESHRFRNESTQRYKKLSEICRGKTRIILVSATPFNNSPADLLNQIALFRSKKDKLGSCQEDMQSFFGRLQKKIDRLDRSKDYDKFNEIVKENALEIREKILRHIMVRRTRKDIVEEYADDLKEQGLKFPEPQGPTPLLYVFNETENDVFDKTIKLITSKEFKYSRYTPLLYLREDLKQNVKQSQRNMSKFMKILLVKRLESSFHAFKMSLNRFINSYEIYLDEFEKGNVYLGRKFSEITKKVFGPIDTIDDELLEKLIKEEKIECFPSERFTEKLPQDLRNDLEILRKIKRLWSKIDRDPKLEKFLSELSTDKVLRENKLIVFTESQETAEYLRSEIEKKFPGTTLCFTGSSDESVRNKVIQNFDARAKNPKNDYRILISTEVLSEGVNLHRANVVINYDIPWNPTRVMQRVGRINRVDTKHDKIYVYNFFPTEQSNIEIKLKEAAQLKVNMFLELLGDDAFLLTEGEPIGTRNLYEKLNSKAIITGDEETEPGEGYYRRIIKEIKDNNPELFKKIKELPPKARSAKKSKEKSESLLTFFRKGYDTRFFIAGEKGKADEKGFLEAIRIYVCKHSENQLLLPKGLYHKFKAKNEQAFDDEVQIKAEPGDYKQNRNYKELLKTLMAVLKTKTATQDEKRYLKLVLESLENGRIHSSLIVKSKKGLEQLSEDITKPSKVVARLKDILPEKCLEPFHSEQTEKQPERREIILSLFLAKE